MTCHLMPGLLRGAHRSPRHEMASDCFTFAAPILAQLAFLLLSLLGCHILAAFARLYLPSSQSAAWPIRPTEPFRTPEAGVR